MIKMAKFKKTWLDGLKCAESLYQRGLFSEVERRISKEQEDSQFRLGLSDYVKHYQEVLKK